MMSNSKSKGFLARLIMAGVSGQSPEDFAEQEFRRMTCEWCADGRPVADGQHNVIGVIVPCDAAALQPERLAEVAKGMQEESDG